MGRIAQIVIGVVALNLAGCSVAPSVETSWSAKAQSLLDQVDAWHETDMTVIELRHALLSLHRRDFGTLDTVERASSEELEARFDAAWATAFYVVNAGPEDQDWLLDEMTRLFSALDARGLVTEEHVRRLYQMAVQARRFDLASRLVAGRHDVELESLPEIDVTAAHDSEPLVWRLSPDTQQMRLGPAKLPHPGIVVLMEPGCGPARRAAADIAADSRLSSIFDRYGRWYVSPSIELALAAQAQWDSAFPRFTLAHVHRMEAFSFVDEPGVSPVFYVFDREHRVVGKVIGWPREGQRDALKALLDQVGLDDPGPGN
jgi:hypothetical protein